MHDRARHSNVSRTQTGESSRFPLQYYFWNLLAYGAQISFNNVQEISSPGEGTMIHYSCDRCDRAINAREEIRYIVRIEVQLAIGNRENDALDEASLEELEMMLDEIELPAGTPEDSNERTFDLCSVCYAEYIDNPLAIEAIGVNFSQN